MNIILPGRVAGLLILVAILVLMEYLRRQALAGKFRSIRKIAAIDAIEQVVGRAAEMGGKVHASIGDIFAQLTQEYATQIFAALSITEYTARLCAKMRVPIIATMMYGETLPLVDETIQQAYKAENRLEDFRKENVRFVAGTQLSYCAGVFEIIQKEKVVGQLLVGPWAYAAVLLGEFGRQAGALQVGGTARIVMIPGFVAVYDYFLIGEELYAGAALVSGDKLKISTVSAQDYSRIASMGLLIVGALLTLTGSQLVQSFLKW